MEEDSFSWGDLAKGVFKTGIETAGKVAESKFSQKFNYGAQGQENYTTAKLNPAQLQPKDNSKLFLYGGIGLGALLLVLLLKR